MKISIYQINMERDEKRVAFMSYSSLNQFQGSPNVNEKIYDEVFSGNVDAKHLEDVYRIFNMEHPADYHARSLSVSDIVEVTESKNVEPGFYFCDDIGFKKIDFTPPDKSQKDTIRVLLVEPGKIAHEAYIGTELEDMQKAVDGQIEQFCIFDDVSIICDEEGKLAGKDLNRAVYDSDGRMIDIMAGTFFVCSSPPESENFESLSNEQMEKYQKLFRYPEQFFRSNGEIQAMKYNPEKNKNYER